MAKTAHSTATPAPAQPGFIDPTTLPDEYAMRVRSDCLAPAIKGGDSVLVDQRQPYAAGDLVCVFLKPECSGGSTTVGLKRLVMNMMPGVTYPYQASPDSNIMPVLVCEQDNPHRQYTIPADQILAIHRCMGLVPDDVTLYDDKTGQRQYKRAAVSAGWSRRDLMAGAVSIVPAAGAAAIVAGTVPAIAGVDHDRAEWLGLWRDFVQKQREDYDACDRYDDARFEASSRHPKQQIRTWRPYFGSHGIVPNVPEPSLRMKWSPSTPPLTIWHPVIDREVIDKHYARCLDWEPVKATPELVADGQACKAQSISDIEAWETACRAIDEQFGVPAFAATYKATTRAREASEAAIVERPANSMAGVAVKLALWVRYYGQAPELGATLDDADEQAGIAAYRDAARLAGLPEDLYAEEQS